MVLLTVTEIRVVCPFLIFLGSKSISGCVFTEETEAYQPLFNYNTVRN